MEINERTKVSLTVLWTAVGAVVATCFLLAITMEKTSATDRRVDRVVDKIHSMESLDNDHQKEMLKMLIDVRDRTIRIEGFLDK